MHPSRGSRVEPGKRRKPMADDEAKRGVVDLDRVNLNENDYPYVISIRVAHSVTAQWLNALHDFACRLAGVFGYANWERTTDEGGAWMYFAFMTAEDGAEF